MYNAKWWSNTDVWMKVLRENPAPIHGLGTTRYQKAQWMVNVYSNSILRQKLSGEKWISTLILKERRNMAWQQEGARELPLGPPVLRSPNPSPPLFQYTAAGPAHTTRHMDSSDLSDKQDRPLLTLGYWRWHTSARCSPVTTPSLAARRWSKSPTMVANRRTQSS